MARSKKVAEALNHPDESPIQTLAGAETSPTSSPRRTLWDHYLVGCPHSGCNWFGSILPVGYPITNVVTFECPQCKGRWYARELSDDVKPLPLKALRALAQSGDETALNQLCLALLHPRFRSEAEEAIRAVKDQKFLAEALEKIKNGIRIVDKPTPSEEPLPPTEHKIEVSVVLPPDPRERLAAVAQLYSDLRKQVVAAIQPAINALLKEAKATPTLSFTQKQELTRDVNEVLTDARLSLLDPETQIPAKLSAHRTDSMPEGRLYLADSRKADDDKRHAPNIDKIDLDETPIELVEHVPGPDGVAAPRGRAARHAPSSGRLR